MNNTQKLKTVYEVGKLPLIISDTKVFSGMTRPERTEFYALVNRTIKNTNKKYLRSQDLYKAMCLYPEKRLNKAFLENKFRDEMLWHFYVSVLEYCLFEHLLRSLNNFQENHKALTTEMKRAEARIQALQEDIEKYSPKVLSYAN